MDAEKILNIVKGSGMKAFALMKQSDIVYDISFKDICERNACGCYGKCWVCPPDIGALDELMKRTKGFSQGILYQNVYELEDSYDIEGMNEGKHAFVMDALKIKKALLAMEDSGEISPSEYFVLGVGACGICEECTRRHGEPCRFPRLAMAPMETCGIFVSSTATNVGLKYINGQNTVTYFGAVLF